MVLLDIYLLQSLMCLLHCNHFLPSSHRRSSLLGTCTGNHLLCWHTYWCTDFWRCIHWYLANSHMKGKKQISDMDRYLVQETKASDCETRNYNHRRVCYLGIHQALAGMGSPQIHGSNCSGNQFRLMSCSSRYSLGRHMIWTVLPLHSCYHL